MSQNLDDTEHAERLNQIRAEKEAQALDDAMTSKMLKKVGLTAGAVLALIAILWFTFRISFWPLLIAVLLVSGIHFRKQFRTPTAQKVGGVLGRLTAVSVGLTLIIFVLCGLPLIWIGAFSSAPVPKNDDVKSDSSGTGKPYRRTPNQESRPACCTNCGQSLGILEDGHLCGKCAKFFQDLNNDPDDTRKKTYNAYKAIEESQK